MKLTKLVILSLAILAASSLGGAAQQAKAGENEDSAQSKVDIEYTTNTEVTPPTDPVDPGNEIIPDPEKPGTGNPGPLSVDYVSRIAFGQQKANGNAAIYYALNDTVINQDGSKKEVPNYVQVTDNRGNNQGWSLAVKQKEQLKNTTSQGLLGAAELSLLNGKTNSTNTLVAAPLATEKVILKLDAAGNGINTNVVTAAKGAGAGTWTNRFGNTAEDGKSSIQLVVPAGTAVEKGAYTTSLIWTLSTDASQ